MFQFNNLLKTNKKLIILGILLLIAIAGCKGGNGGKQPITDVDVRKGIEGLVIGFTKGAPPDQVYENGPFPIALNLKNIGAFNIENGKLAFIFEKNYVDAAEGSQEEYNFDVEGKSIFNPKGDEKFLTINAQTKGLGAQSEMQASNIRATACYIYKTILGDTLCIDPDVYGIRKTQKVCQMKELNYADGQGGPVAITKIETRMLPDPDQTQVKPHFIIYIENKGNGEVITPDSDVYEKACTSESLNSEDFNRIKITARLSTDELMECGIGSNDNEFQIRLRDKMDTVRCTSNGINANQDAYTAPINIELEYGYTTTISKDITIQKVLKY